jgi:hypothetical protein
MKNSWIENPNGGNMLYYLLYMHKFLFLRNTKIVIFGGSSKFHLLDNLGQFWVDFASFAVAESMPEARLKFFKTL